MGYRFLVFDLYTDQVVYWWYERHHSDCAIVARYWMDAAPVWYDFDRYTSYIELWSYPSASIE